MLRSSFIVGLSAGSIGLALSLSSSAVAAPYTAWQHPYNDTDTNVFAHLHMDETSGTVADNTGTLGTVSDGTYSAAASSNVASGAGIPGGDFGNAFDTVGGTKYITVPSNPDSVGPFADGYVIETWFKKNSAADGVIAAKYDTTLGYPGGRQWSLEIYQGKLYFGSFRSDAVILGLAGTTTLNAGEWHHVAVQYDSTQSGGNRWEMFLDGNLETSANYGAWAFTTAANPIYIGRYNATEYAFDGQIDEFRISSGQYDFQPVPEPAALSLIALAGLLAKRRK